MSPTAAPDARTEIPGDVPEAYPACRPEREDSIVPLLAAGAALWLFSRLRRWRARRRIGRSTVSRRGE